MRPSSIERESTITLPADLERDADGRCLCPAEGCDYRTADPFGIPSHYKSHDTSLTADLFGADRWADYLEQEHIENGLAPKAIAKEFGAHIGEKRVRGDLQEHGLYLKLLTGQLSDSARILIRRDVETIADAQRVAAKRRGEL